MLLMEKIISITSQNVCRLDELLRKKIPEVIKKEISNSKIRRLIVAGAVEVNKKQCRIPGYELQEGAAVKMHLDDNIGIPFLTGNKNSDNMSNARKFQHKYYSGICGNNQLPYKTNLNSISVSFCGILLYF